MAIDGYRPYRRAVTGERRRHPAERRGQARLRGCPPVSVAGLPGSVFDVSRHGICLTLREPVSAGERYHLTLRDATDLTCVEIDAEVIWQSEERAGLRWLNLLPEQDRWLFQHFQNWLRMLDGASRR